MRRNPPDRYERDDLGEGNVVTAELPRIAGTLSAHTSLTGACCHIGQVS